MKVALDAVIIALEQKSILLIQRAKEPYRDQWGTPGGFLEEDELLADGARRELEEETGLKLQTLTPLTAQDRPDRDPRARVIAIPFLGIVPSETQVKAADDAKEAKWWPLDSLPELAPADYDLMIQEAVAMLHSHADYVLDHFQLDEETRKLFEAL